MDAYQEGRKVQFSRNTHAYLTILHTEHFGNSDKKFIALANSQRHDLVDLTEL